MKSLYIKKLALFSVLSGSISLFFYFLRVLTIDDFHMFFPVIIVALLFIVFGIVIIINIKLSIGNPKLPVIGLFILWLSLEIIIIIIFFLTLTDPLLMFVALLYPIYPLYFSVKFLFLCKKEDGAR